MTEQNWHEEAQNLSIRAEEILEEILIETQYDPSAENGFKAQLAVTCSLIQADSIRELANAVMCLTTGTDRVMGIAESLHLIEKKFSDLACGYELMEIAESIKNANCV